MAAGGRPAVLMRVWIMRLMGSSDWRAVNGRII
jgi:hypothetical protein